MNDSTSKAPGKWLLGLVGWAAMTLLVSSGTLVALPTGEGEVSVGNGERLLALAGGTEVRLGRGGTYSITTGDGRESGVRSGERSIRLANRSFDPLVQPNRVRLLAGVGRLFLLQYETQPLEAYRDALSRLGVRVHRFVPGQTVIAHVPPRAEALVRELPFVRWMGPFFAADRLEPALLAGLEAGRLPLEAEYTLQLVRPGEGDKHEVAREVRAWGGRTTWVPENGYLMRAVLSREALMRVAALDQVLWVERAAGARTGGAPAPIDNVRIDGGMDVVEQLTGFTGLGVRGEVLDDGLDRNHPDFQHHRPILHGQNTGQVRHGTGTHGAVFGDGTTDPKARALLPEGQSVFASFRRLVNRYRHTAELLEPPYEVVFQTNSWGNGPSPPGYPSLSFEMDDLIHTYDLLTCQAFGNAGRARAFRQAWAKNVVTVGGIRHRNTLEISDDAWGGGASAGPATDGRIKPDLSYWNDQIWSTGPGGTHRNIAGTSAATPCVAGHFGAFYQMWHEESFGNVAPGEDVFASRPRSATARAFLLNTAEPYPFAGPQHDLRRTTQGWGRPNALRLYEARTNLLIVDEWRPLRNLGSARYAVEVEQGQERFRATLVYTDPPGNSAAAEHRVNDLSLRVTAPDGTTYWGNAGLRDGNESVAGTTEESRDTVEQVWITGPAPGSWIVDVLATEVVQDAHLATPERDAAFALVVGPIAPVVDDLGRCRPHPGCDPGPSLSARGSFVANSPWRFEAHGLGPGAQAVLVLGRRLNERPQAGACRTILGPRHWIPLDVDASGSATLSGVFPDDVGPGRIYAQVWTRGKDRWRSPRVSNVLALQATEVPGPVER